MNEEEKSPGRYECVECKLEFERGNGPGGTSATGGVGCPRCGSLYMRWLDYEKFKVPDDQNR